MIADKTRYICGRSRGPGYNSDNKNSTLRRTPVLALLGMMLLPVLKTAALMVPGAGLVFGAAIEQTEVERYDYVVPRDLGEEPIDAPYA